MSIGSSAPSPCTKKFQNAVDAGSQPSTPPADRAAEGHARRERRLVGGIEAGREQREVMDAKHGVSNTPRGPRMPPLMQTLAEKHHDCRERPGQQRTTHRQR